MPLASSVYLFAQFWSHLQILRGEALYTNLRAAKEGLWLQGFMDTLESSKIRLVERARQRGIGEAMIAADRQRPITLYEFLERFGDRQGRLREWLAPMTEHSDSKRPKDASPLIGPKFGGRFFLVLEPSGPSP